jgi:hypothetical protein
MRRFLTGGLVVLLVSALFALVALAPRSRVASAAQYQYQGRPSLTLSVVDVSSTGYTLHVAGSNYFAGGQPGGQLQLTCLGKKGSTCGPAPDPWPSFGVDVFTGEFGLDYVSFACGSNIKSAVAVDNNGVKSNAVKGAC